jgi:hypothetical protein
MFLETLEVLIDHFSRPRTYDFFKWILICVLKFLFSLKFKFKSSILEAEVEKIITRHMKHLSTKERIKNKISQRGKLSLFGPLQN